VAQGLSIVGYFHANERFDDVELCGVAKNIGDHISRYFPQAPILLVIKCLILYFQMQHFRLTILCFVPLCCL